MHATRSFPAESEIEAREGARESQLCRAGRAAAGTGVG